MVFAGLLVPDEREVLQVGVPVVDKVVEHDELEVPLQVHRVRGHVPADPLCLAGQSARGARVVIAASRIRC